MEKYFVTLVLLIFLISCSKSEKHRDELVDHKGQLQLTSSVYLGEAIAELISEFVLENNIQSGCVLRVYIDKINGTHTSINIVSSSELPTIGDYKKVYIKTWIDSFNVYFITDLDNYVYSKDDAEIVKYSTNRECDYFGLGIDSMGVIKWRNNISTLGYFNRSIKTHKELFEFSANN